MNEENSEGNGPGLIVALFFLSFVWRDDENNEKPVTIAEIRTGAS
jgi:hypothetical protein